MTLLSAILALALEQFRPLAVATWVQAPLERWSAFLEGRLNAGQYRQGVIAWGLAVALPSILLQILYGLALWFEPLLALVLAIAALYLTMGFRQFSHFFTDIHLALRMGELARARQLLAQWRQRSGDRLNSSEVAKLAIEQALLASHRHVYGPLFWFAVLGPGAALGYRLSLFFAQAWGARQDAEFGRFGEFARRAFAWIDWLPVRLTAAGFAVVGDFEDAIYCWRAQAAQWPAASEGILLSSGAGALGVRLGSPLHDDIDLGERPELGVGDEADADFMQSTVGLVWRTLVLGVLLMALFWVAGWVGH